ncbi:kinase-like protein [Apiospora saccharicola]|uniref:EKC/KEOPS complex subunit BUD32 n=1 Tax=Apiospora saccharicola TaxID=335842 RepID=A0ABR1UNM3_9PEZI
MSASNTASTGSSLISLENPEPAPKYSIPMWGSDEVEDVERYEPGGLHPVKVGEFFQERFEVHHKLGNGGFAVVWLCRDHREGRWCALKIIESDHSSEKGGELQILRFFSDKGIDRQEAAAHHVMLPEEHFWIDGPNGRHLALVSPLLGPSLSYWLNEGKRTFDAMNTFCRQMTKSLQFLHGLGVGHGDFRPANILLKIRNIDDMSEDDIVEIFSGPQALRVSLNSGEESSPHAPEYLVKPMWWGRAMEEGLVLDEIAIVDFGEAFVEGQTKRFPGIPRDYAAPEIIYNQPRSLESDLWSLGASIMDVYGGSFFSQQVLPATKTLEKYFGPLPVEYRGDFEEQHRAYLTSQREYEDLEERNLLKQGLSEYVDQEPKTEPSAWFLTEAQRTDPFRPVSYSSAAEFAETDQEVVEKEYPHRFSIPLSYMNTSFFKESDPRYNANGRWYLEREEILLLTDLALKIFRYNPQERLKPAQILKHPWLKEEGTDEVEDEDDGSSMGLGVLQMVMDLLWPSSWRYHLHHCLV